MGRSLEVLLQAAGYDTRFQREPLADELGALLTDSRLLLIAPSLSTESRKTLADIAVGPAKKTPVLELLPTDGGKEVGIQGADAAPWPCSLETLKQRVRAALLAQD